MISSLISNIEASELTVIILNKELTYLGAVHCYSKYELYTDDSWRYFGNCTYFAIISPDEHR